MENIPIENNQEKDQEVNESSLNESSLNESSLNESSLNEDLGTSEERGWLEYLWQTGFVLKEKTWSSLWKFDLFQKVKRAYPDESYYQNITSIMTQDASHIIDQIWIGSAFNAADYRWLKSTGISLIVNITSDISNYYPDEFAYINYETEDLQTGHVEDYLDNFVQLVNLNPNKKILVHCFAGKSRSASLVLYYLMKKHGMSLEDGMAYLKEKRPNANINCKFIEEIQHKFGTQNKEK